ncbi:MAG: HAMP domain-containing histidine kinase [Verrucomicrobiae bacterium]|nr:HAMP domain-containing histidine kinase [Verrucomicrobiae bacterium]
MNVPRPGAVALPALTLPWLRRLRWTAVAGQTLAVWFVIGWLRLPLPLEAVFLCIGCTALSNLALHGIPAGRAESPSALAAILATDVMLLTALLYFTGGPHNPFSSFYLVHVALAAVVLPPLWAVPLAGLCCGGYGLLFLGRSLLPPPGDAVCGIGPNLPLPVHLRGMLIAFVLTAAAVVFFAGRLQQALRLRESELARTRELAAQNERFAALATLAAGAAHELGSPLGTIALAAGEIARAAQHLPGHGDLADDAALIREEAARCRAILDRLEQQAGDTPRSLAVHELLHQLRGRFARRALVIEAAAAPRTVFAPPEALAQALAALVKNALDASPAECSVVVRVHTVGLFAQFEVADHGSGLSAAAHAHAGEPFFSTKPPGQGMGLGLFLVRLLAQRLAGEFAIEPRPSGGTRAILRLPQLQS